MGRGQPVNRETDQLAQKQPFTHPKEHPGFPFIRDRFGARDDIFGETLETSDNGDTDKILGFKVIVDTTVFIFNSMRKLNCNEILKVFFCTWKTLKTFSKHIQLSKN